MATEESKTSESAVLRPLIAPHSFNGWIEENKSSFKPPVGNKMMYGAGQHKVMFIGGPNERKDYHIEEGEELFWQIQGDMVLEIMEKGVPKSVPIKEGEMFLLPKRIPHSPQRAADTVGFVMERERLEHESDVLAWYVDGTTEFKYREVFHCYDLGSELGPVIGRYKASEEFATNRPTGKNLPDLPFELDTTTTVMEPFNFEKWVSEEASTSNKTLFGGDNEYAIEVVTQATSWKDSRTLVGEGWFHVIRGSVTLTVTGGEKPEEVEVGSDMCFLLPKGYSFTAEWSGGLGLLVTSSVAM